MEKLKQRRGQRKASAWSKSLVRNAEGLTFRDVAIASLRKIHATRSRQTKCSARAKSTGESCRNLAMGNGKCRYHGGATPKHDQWHKPQLPTRGGKSAVRKVDLKLAKQAKAAAARRLRLTRATEKERERYAQWLVDHMPGDAARRAARRLDRRIADETRLLKHAPKTTALDVQEIEDRLAELRARKAIYDQWTKGVFA